MENLPHKYASIRKYNQVTKDEKIAQYTYVTKWKAYQLWNSWMFYLFDLFLYIYTPRTASWLITKEVM